MSSGPGKDELVVLVHGLASTRWIMWPLARRVRHAGFATRLWTYFTLGGSNRVVGRRLAGELNRLADSGRFRQIHVVAHSMGGIAMRCAMEHTLPEQLGRVVMVGTPNHGSHVATRLTRFYGRLSPTLHELRDTPDSFVNQLPTPPGHAEIGVIATANDRVVALESTHLDGQRDHCLVPGLHTAALWTPECAGQVVHFLRQGAFATARRGAAAAASGA